VIPSLWLYIRPLLVKIKRYLFLERPFGFASLGTGSLVKWPRNIRGRRSIRVGKQSQILSNSFMLAVSEYEGQHYRPSIQIGDNVYVGRYSYLVACDEISIADGCVLSEHVYITDLNHGYNPQGGLILKQAIESKGPVRIGPNCFLGYRTTVTPGVTLGEWCVVGANSVVTRSFPAYSMIAGAPAKVIKVYSHEMQQWVSPDALE
jgi:acetyltransferase-like isoleucine patch superfamily enzyme